MESCPKAGPDMADEPSTHCATPRPAAPEKGTIAAGLLPAETPASMASQSGRQIIAKPRPNVEEGLPSDVLEVITGFMDPETLCTARLASKTFCTAASPHICSLTLRSTSQAVSRHRFPRLGRVSVYHSGEEVDPDLRELITTLTIRDCQNLPMAETLSQLALMPKLQHLNVWWNSGEEFHVEGTAALSCHVIGQERLRISDEKWVSRPLGSTDVSWLQQATALRNLRALSIVGPKELSLSLIGDLTGLTGLTWSYPPRRAYFSLEPSLITPLTRLTKLRSLRLGHRLSGSGLEAACSLGSGLLVSLDLFVFGASIDCARYLTRQSALKCLGLYGVVCNLRYIGALRVELLQSLKLRWPTSVDAEGFAALRRATSLAQLYIRVKRDPQPGPFDTRALGLPLPGPFLSQALAGLTQLRTLILEHDGHSAKFLDYNLALRPLTGLTELAICGGALDDADLRVLLVLTRLRVLDLCNSCLTHDVVPELGVLTDLEMLRLFECGVTSLAPVTELVNPLRYARGWPPMIARLQ